MNIINAAFVRNGVTIRTLPVYQFDHGMILQISGLDDLPSTFRADFANTETGQSKSVIGTDGEVHIPYEYFVPGATIHCWLVWTGADYAVTRKHIMIPVARRATPTDEEPSPEEQGVIDQAIAELNNAVEQTGQDVETAAGYAEQAEQSAQAATDAQNAAEAAKDQTVESAADAAASAQSASESAQSAFQSKTDAQAAAASVAGAMDTLDATIQADLQAAKESGMFDGADGVSPTVTITPITGGHQVMITDAEGERSFDVTDGEPGADGFSPVATVTQTQTGATISITDKAGTTTAQISNGAKGDPGDDYVLTAQDKAEIAQQAAEGVDVPVQDVQVNGTSILDAQGVANVPQAENNRIGVVKPYAPYGVGITNEGNLYASKAENSQLKTGTNWYKVVVPYNQDASVYYALAKLAGADMASLSGETVGVYPEAQKVAIQKMLGIYEAPWELIREDTFTNETEADHTINVDANGQAFELTDVVLVFTTPKQSTESGKGDYGRIRFYYGSNNSSYIGTYINAYTQTANGEQRTAMSKITQSNGLLEAYSRNNSNRTNTSVSLIASCNVIDVAPSTTSIQAISPPIAFNRIVITAVTGTAKYWLYGRRKWN